jgi:hypothetical protein
MSGNGPGNLFRPTKRPSPPHAVFLLIKLLHMLDVVDWKTMGLNVTKLNQYSDRYADVDTMAKRNYHANSIKITEHLVDFLDKLNIRPPYRIRMFMYDRYATRMRPKI